VDHNKDVKANQQWITNTVQYLFFHRKTEAKQVILSTPCTPPDSQSPAPAALAWNEPTATDSQKALHPTPAK
jgi:hypothetical protein